MDRSEPFKASGELSLAGPLRRGFDKVLFDLVQLTAVKSGFDDEDSSKIAEKVADSLFKKFQSFLDGDNAPQIEISMAYRPGQIKIKTTIPSLNFCDEEVFQSRSM